MCEKIGKSVGNIHFDFNCRTQNQIVKCNFESDHVDQHFREFHEILEFPHFLIE